jgi:hypothetical protein
MQASLECGDASPKSTEVQATVTTLVEGSLKGHLFVVDRFGAST